MIVVLMGVSGAGKTTVGHKLAAVLGCGFTDADEFHSQANIEKMKSGIALHDADRAPWLRSMREAIERWERQGADHVLACSALKERYRHVLAPDDPQVTFVYLKADAEVLAKRLGRRSSHFFNPTLLKSQFDALEEPSHAITVDASQTPDQIVDLLVGTLMATAKSSAT
jgi:gluconokinase